MCQQWYALAYFTSHAVTSVQGDFAGHRLLYALLAEWSTTRDTDEATKLFGASLLNQNQVKSNHIIYNDTPDGRVTVSPKTRKVVASLGISSLRGSGHFHIEQFSVKLNQVKKIIHIKIPSKSRHVSSNQ